MIKISNGTKKGFKLKVPSNGHVRPKTSKVRKMIFDIIQDVNNYHILDLFAGCGSLGIESLSMGAKFVTFVDNSMVLRYFLYKGSLSFINIINSFCHSKFKYK